MYMAPLPYRCARARKQARPSPRLQKHQADKGGVPSGPVRSATNPDHVELIGFAGLAAGCRQEASDPR